MVDFSLWNEVAGVIMSSSLVQYLNSVGVTLWQWVNLLTPFPLIQMLLCRLCPWHMCHCSMYSTFNGFDLQSSWMSIMMPSGGTQYKAHQQGRIQGLSLIRITPLIWIKILEASWLTAFNHFDVLLKRASLLVCATWASAGRRWLLYKTGCVCFCCLSAWAGLTDVVHTGQIFMHVRITYRRKRAFLSLCSFPWSSRPHTRMCRHPPAGNKGFPRHHWLSSCPLSWGRVRHPLSSS